MNHVATTEIVAYNEFRAQLAELRDLNDKTVFDYHSAKGNREARSHIHKLRRTKAAVDTCRKAEKKASLEYGRKVDGEAKEIISEIEDMIEVHQTPLLEIEQKEKQRVDTILDMIETIRIKADNTLSLSADSLQLILDNLIKQEITEEVFQEFTEQAAGAKTLTIDTLEGLVAERRKYEDEQAELVRLRQEKEERDRQDREAKIAQAAADRAKRQVEERAKRQQDEAKLREERLEQEKAFAIQEKKDAEARAKQAQKDAEQRFKRDLEEKKRQEADAQAKREANKRHVAKIEKEAIAALVDNALLTQEKAKLIIMLIKNGQIPNVSIRY